MNKKLIVWVTVGVMAAIVGLWSLLRVPSIGNSHSVLAALVSIPLLVLAFPIRLYVILFLGENGSWPFPLLAILLTLSGLFWGVIVERIASALAARKSVRQRSRTI